MCSIEYTLHAPCSTLSTHENLGTNLRKTLEKAWKWSKTQREVAKTLNASISAGAVERWEKMVSDYKQDRRRPNPFEEHETGTSMTPCMWLVLISLQLFPSPLLGTSSCRRTPMPRKGVPFNYTIQVHQLSCGKRWTLKRNCHELKSCSPRFAPYVLRFAT